MISHSRNKCSLLCFFLTIIFTSNGLADKASFVYDDHGHIDPFFPFVTRAGAMVMDDSDLSLSDLVLEGIVADASGKNAAIINGKIVIIGDVIGLYVVKAIDIDQVQVNHGDKISVIKLKKGDF